MTDLTSMGTGALSSDTTHATSLSTRFYSAVWRWHFYAGIFVAPFLIMLALTGLFMMYTAVIDGREGEKFTVAAEGTAQPVSAQAASALASVPDGSLVEWISPYDETIASVFRVKDGEAQKMIAVNPYNGEVMETWSRRDGWYDFASDIHGSLLLGDTGDMVIETAAGFGIILVITGLYLWWPRNGKRATSLLVPDFSARGRAFWKSLHQTVGFCCSALLLVFLLSGMSWTGVWGEKLVQAWSTFPAEKWDNVPLSDSTHADMNHGAIKDVPWALEQTAMPASGSAAGVTGVAEGTAINIDSISALGRSLGFEGRFRVNYPGGETGVWTLSQDSMSNDSPDPMSDRTVHIDQYSGKVLAEVGFEDYSLPGQAMAVGIAFHEGDMGLWNIVLNTVFCLSVAFIAISGLVMWWKRRPSRAGRLAAPPMPQNLPLWKGAVVVMLLVSLAFPMVGITLLSVLALDVLVIQKIKPLARAMS